LGYELYPTWKLFAGLAMLPGIVQATLKISLWSFSVRAASLNKTERATVLNYKRLLQMLAVQESLLKRVYEDDRVAITLLPFSYQRLIKLDLTTIRKI